MHAILWTCLDKDGHDACRIVRDAAGWTLQGAAVCRQAGQVAHLGYRLHCDPQWSSIRATVDGWVGSRNMGVEIVRTAPGCWLVNGRVEPSLAGLQDIDLGFTPASNTSAIRRLNLKDGETAGCVAVWLDSADWEVKALHQTYRRIHAHAYDYSAPGLDFRATLAVDDFGVVTEYPGLWQAARPAA